MINNAINNGAFVLQHRDHGYEQGWGEPAYSSNNINGLTNTDLTFIFSINCLTGKYNLSGECFTEKFHHYTSNGLNSGALGVIAASEVSYSFVNDTYVWGIYDNMWPEFLPQYGTTPDHRGILPAFGNAAGKYFLQQSSWPYNTGNKEVTYNLFHHHGDAFLTLYTEVPQDLTVLHNNVLLEGLESFSVFADEGALIGLTVNGEIIGTGVGTGEPVQISISGQTAGSQVIITVTKQNYYRYESAVEVIESDIPYVVEVSFSLNDAAGNGNGLMDYGESILLSMTLENIGTIQAENVTAVLSTENEFISITNNTAIFGDILPGTTVTMDDAFAFDVDYLIPDNENVLFDITATDGTDTWVSQIIIKSYAPVLEFVDFEIDDSSGNNNGRLDPGETVDITVQIANEGSSAAFDVFGELSASDPYIIINSDPQAYGNLIPGNTGEQTFSVTVDALTPEGYTVEFAIIMTGEGGIGGMGSFLGVVGRFVALVLDLDPNNYSGPQIFETFNNMDLNTEYATSFPENLELYENIFVCLGIHFVNHELSQAEGQKLKDFLLNGGNIWMEGRVTWNDDLQTPVHEMFNIEVVDQYTYVMQDILGVQETFTEGFSFTYDGNLPVNDYEILPVYPAVSVFIFQDPVYGCGVANNAGDYRTIGSTFEFGELLDGAAPNTKVELMQKILGWFDGTLTGFDGHDLSSLNSQEYLESYPNPFNNETALKIVVEKDSRISLNIYNMQGELIKTVINDEYFTQGTYEFVWEGENNSGNQIPNGVYFGVLHSAEQTNTLKLIITK